MRAISVRVLVVWKTLTPRASSDWESRVVGVA